MKEKLKTLALGIRSDLNCLKDLYYADHEQLRRGLEEYPDDIDEDIKAFLLDHQLAPVVSNPSFEDDPENNPAEIIELPRHFDDVLANFIKGYFLDIQTATNERTGATCVEISICLFGPDARAVSLFDRNFELQCAWGSDSYRMDLGADLSDFLRMICGLDC